jgi:SHS2 domain-containing protein
MNSRIEDRVFARFFQLAVEPAGLTFPGSWGKISRGAVWTFMEKYRILPHPADGKFQAFGTTLEEALGNAALAMSSFMWDWSKVEPRVRHFVHVRAIDREQLLVKFLGETIYLFETKRFLLGKVDGLRIRQEFEGFSLEALLGGDTLSDRYELFGDVKAVTYHELKIEECGGFTVQVVVDL